MEKLEKVRNEKLENRIGYKKIGDYENEEEDDDADDVNNAFINFYKGF